MNSCGERLDNLIERTGFKSTKRPGLLVSVRNVEEARVVAPDADILDVKDTDNGPLGRPNQETLVAIMRIFGSTSLTSVALGEVVDNSPGQIRDYLANPELQNTVSFAKLGCSNLAGEADWKHVWRNRLSEIPDSIEPVAVAYADHMDANSPSIEEVIKFASAMGLSKLLIDTFAKDGRCLFDYCSAKFLRHILNEADQLQLEVVMAGSITEMALPKVFALGPKFVGVRGAVCEKQNRESNITRKSYNQFIEKYNSDWSGFADSNRPNRASRIE